MTPYALKLVAPIQSGAVFLKFDGEWCLTEEPETQSCIFPSEVLARRYAESILQSSGQTFMPFPMPDGAVSFSETGAKCRRCGCSDHFACPASCWWVERNLCSECVNPTESVSWGVFDSPEEYPGKFVARRFINAIPTNNVLIAETLDELRVMQPVGFVPMTRFPDDDHSVVETWERMPDGEGIASLLTQRDNGNLRHG